MNKIYISSDLIDNANQIPKKVGAPIDSATLQNQVTEQYVLVFDDSKLLTGLQH
jgi:hypothetical protein